MRREEKVIVDSGKMEVKFNLYLCIIYRFG